MRPREQEREQDSKCTALLGTPALGTNLKATADLVKMGGKRQGASEDGGTGMINYMPINSHFHFPPC